MKTNILIEAQEIHTRTVRKVGNTAGVYVPKTLIGRKVHVVVGEERREHVRCLKCKGTIIKGGGIPESEWCRCPHPTILGQKEKVVVKELGIAEHLK